MTDTSRAHQWRGDLDLYRRAVLDAAIGMSVAGPDGSFLEVNHALCDLFGLDADTMLTRTWQELTHPDDLGNTLAMARRMADGELDRYHLTTRFLCAGGDEFVGEVSVSAVRDADGRLLATVAQVVDITARLRAEEDLQASRDTYRVLAENASDVVYRIDERGVCTWISPSVLAVLGWRPEELVGRDLAELVHPDDAGAAEAAERAMLSAHAAQGPALELRFRHPDGSYSWMSVRWRPVYGDDGAPIGGVNALRDVDHEVEFRNALIESQTLLRVTVDSLLDPWVLLAPVRDDNGAIVDFVYTDANQAACEANRLTRDELLGRRLLSLFPDHVGTGLLEMYARVVDTGDPLTLDDYPFPSLDGAVRRYDNRAVRIGDHLSFSWRDVTERYEARQHFARLAHHDALTGLANRAQLQDRIADLFGRQARVDTYPAVLFCDLDDFKDVNDSLGHAAGDAVLREVAQRIVTSVRTHDVVARIGGDEFVVVLDGVRDTAEAVAVGDKIRAAVARPIPVEGGTPVVSVSIGVALADEGDDPDRVIRAADTALYRAKESGRDRVVAIQA